MTFYRKGKLYRTEFDSFEGNFLTSLQKQDFLEEMKNGPLPKWIPYDQKFELEESAPSRFHRPAKIQFSRTLEKSNLIYS